MDFDEAKRVIDRILQLHKPELQVRLNGDMKAVCSHCRGDVAELGNEEGGRVLMPCPTTRIVRAAAQRP